MKLDELSKDIENTKNLISKIPENITNRLLIILRQAKTLSDLDRINAIVHKLSDAFDTIESDVLSKSDKPKTNLPRNTHYNSLLNETIYPQTKDWIVNFVDYLKTSPHLSKKLDKLFDSWLISIVNHRYLKLWEVTIGKYKTKFSQLDHEDFQWEQFIDFLSKLSEILWLPFTKSNDTYDETAGYKNKLDKTLNEFTDDNQEFWINNDWSELLKIVWILINREDLKLPLFVFNNEHTAIMVFWKQDKSDDFAFYDVSSMANMYTSTSIK